MDTQEINHTITPRPPEAIERATVGRRVWVWTGHTCPAPLNVHDQSQPFDAGVLYVHTDGRVNLLVTDHYGQQAALHGVHLFNPADDNRHNATNVDYATWMPFQRKQQTTEAALKTS